MIQELKKEELVKFGAAACTVLLAFLVLFDVVWTVFFAATLAYVLEPARRRMDSRGFDPKLSAGILTLGLFVGLGALALPIILVLYQRREILINFLSNLPEDFAFEFLGLSYTVETATLVQVLQDYVTSLAFDLASSAPSLSLQAILVVFLVYAAVARPHAVRSTVSSVFPSSLDEDLIQGYSDRLGRTLFGLYVVQAATAALTFVVSLPVYFFLGYEAFFSLAVISGILQFIPVVGPSAVVAVLSAFELATVGPGSAIFVLIAGIILIGFLPDALIRPRLASRTTGLPASLYFLGFIGGVLTVGAVGVIAGPVAVALVVESVEILSRKHQ